MIDIIIPSFDRAAQLELLLRSLETYWNFDQLNINVLCKWSNSSYEEGYNKLFTSKKIQFFYEVDFDRQIKELISCAQSKSVGFLVDDCVMFRYPLISPQEIKKLLVEKENICYSLRLGCNTCIQDYQLGILQPSLHYTHIDDNTIRWRWNRYNSQYNWSYIFSWDGHFYNKTWLLDKIVGKNFESPRALEYQLSIDEKVRDIAKPYMLASKESSVFCNTINRVQPNGPDAGTKHYYSIKDLNDRWLADEQISLKSFNDLQLQSCHEEFPLQWEELGF